MSRLATEIMNQTGPTAGKSAPAIDLKFGGQNGLMPNYEEYSSNKAYVKGNIIALLVAEPEGFADLDQPERWTSTLKALVELLAKSIEGLNSTLSVEFAENAVGGAGEMQEDVTNVTRARSTPTFVWLEKYGKPVTAFLEGWILNLMMDPNTKYPAVVTRGLKKPSELLPSYTGMTVIFIEPDPTGTKVINSWLCTNMHPKSAGDNTGKRDLTAPGETLDLSIEFTALTQTGLGVYRLAQKFLDQMNMTGANANLRPAFVQDITANVKAGDAGYVAAVNAAGKTAVKP